MKEKQKSYIQTHLFHSANTKELDCMSTYVLKP